MAELQTYNARPIGVAPDLSAANCPPDLYSVAENVRFDEDKARRTAGFTYRDPAPIFKPERLHYRKFSGVDQWLYAGADGIGLDSGQQHDITPAAFVQDMTLGLHGWTSLNDIPVWNHRELTPHFHDGVLANIMQPIPAWPAGWSCNRMVAFKFFLLALGGSDGVSEINDQVRWSSSADPGLLPAEWMPTAENDAGDLVLGEPEGAIVDAVPLRDSLVVYKTNSIHMLQYIGGLFVFTPRTIFPKTGLLTAGCAVEYKGRHYAVTQGDVIVHDGARAESIADGTVRKAIFDDISGSLLDRAFAYVDTADLSFCFCYPTRDAAAWCNRRARYHMGGGPNQGRWTFEKLEPDEVSHVAIGQYTQSGVGGDWDSDTFTWDTKPGSWDDTALQGVGDQSLEAMHDAVQLGQPTVGGQRGAMTPVASLIWESKQLIPGRAALVDHIWPVLENPAGASIKMRFGIQTDYDAPIDWSDEMEVNAKVGVDVGRRARLFSVLVRAEAQQDWAIAGFDIDYRDAGRW